MVPNKSFYFENFSKFGITELLKELAETCDMSVIPNFILKSMLSGTILSSETCYD